MWTPESIERKTKVRPHVSADVVASRSTDAIQFSPADLKASFQRPKTHSKQDQNHPPRWPQSSITKASITTNWTRSTKINPIATSTTSIASPKNFREPICRPKMSESPCGAQMITSEWVVIEKSSRPCTRHWTSMALGQEAHGTSPVTTSTQSLSKRPLQTFMGKREPWSSAPATSPTMLLWQRSARNYPTASS
jgi:hypothetical protein